MPINPLQPYQVRIQAQPTSLQIQTLLQFYQPLIGAHAVSLYLTFANHPVDDTRRTHRTIHTRLLDTLNIDIGALNSARHYLEAVGLLRTYREKMANVETDRQTLLYDVQLPLEVHQFVKHPLLSTTLFSRIGDQNYYQLLKQWEIEPIDPALYREVTVSFNELFKYPDSSTVQTVVEGTEQRQFKHQFVDEQLQIESTTFDFATFFKYLVAEGVDSSQFTYALKYEVLAIHEVYGLDEIQMTQVALLAINDMTDQIQLDALRQIADKKQFFNKKRTNEAGKAEVSDEVFQARFMALKQAIPDLSENYARVIVLCEQLPHDTLLNSIKESKGGFATDSERFFIRDLAAKSSLPSAVLNLLMYHLLVWQGRSSLFKGELQRVANEWQQQKLATSEQVIQYLRRKDEQANETQIKGQQRYQSKRREGIIPQWMKRQTNQKEHTTSADTSQYDEAEIRAEIDKLFEGGNN